MNFSFFYAPGGSGYIRGYQMANYLKGKHNPTSGFENDLCIYVKVIPPENYPKHTYCDVDDSYRQVEWLKTHTDTGIIGISVSACEYLKETLKRDDIHFIPHQHVNFERWVRPDRPVKTVGIIGSKTAFQHPVQDLKERLGMIGLELIYEPEYWETYKTNEKQEMRLNIVDFHKKMDIQVVWRPGGFIKEHSALRNPNKLGNASSFGIPTISYPEKNYIKEWGDRFLHADTIEQMVNKCKKLKEDKRYYHYYADRALVYSERYHIENIAKSYQQLP